MKLLLSTYTWLHVLFRGHYPSGMLVMLSNQPHTRPSAPSSHLLPGDIGISFGRWEAYRHPGFRVSGTRVLVGGTLYNLENFDLMLPGEMRRPCETRRSDLASR